MNLFKIPGVKKDYVVPVNDIIRVEAVSNYSRIYFSDGKQMIVAKVLHWFEEKLPMETFARVHRSHLINSQFIQKINGSNADTLLLVNGEAITMSRRKKQSFVLNRADQLPN